CTHFLVTTLADLVVRPWLRHGNSTPADPRAGLGPLCAKRRRTHDEHHSPARCPVLCSSPRTRRTLVSILQDYLWASRWGRGDRGEQHLSPIDGPGKPEGILLPMALHGFWRHVSERSRARRRLGNGCCRGLEAWRHTC